MTKDRNTFAKRQREMDRKHKADVKRQRRVKKKQEAAMRSESDAADATEPVGDATTDSSSTDSSSVLSDTERSVLNIFRRFQMETGQMLCLSRSEVETFHQPLAELADRGLIVAEKFAGGYSLTPNGFAAMRSLA